MRLLLDECLPRRAKFLFAEAGHECETVRDAGFSGKENGELIELAEKKFEVLITIDKNIRHQQNITGRNIAILIIRAASNDLDDIRPHVPQALAALKAIKPSQIVEWEFSLDRRKKNHPAGQIKKSGAGAREA